MTARHRLHRRGSIVPLVAIALLGLITLIAMAVDIGLLAVAATQAQDLADAAALAGTRQLNGDATINTNLAAAQSVATDAAGDNKILGAAPTGARVTLKNGIYTYASSVQRFS